MIVGGTVAGFAVPRTYAMSILRDLQRRPVIFGQCGDQASDHAGLAHIARMPADHDDRHRNLTSRAKVPAHTASILSSLGAPRLPAPSDIPVPALPVFPRTRL